MAKKNFNSIILNRLKYFKTIYSDQVFLDIVNNLSSAQNWSDIQADLIKIKDNNVRGNVYEELARALILTLPEFKERYEHVYFNHFPSWVKVDLNIEDGDYGIDAIGKTYDGEYHAFQMKHKTDEKKKVYWSSDRISNFYGDADRAARLIVMSNTHGPCDHFKLKAGDRYIGFERARHHDLTPDILHKMGQLLEERIYRHKKLTEQKAKGQSDEELIAIGINLYSELRSKYPEQEIEIPKKVLMELYSLNGKPFYVADFDTSMLSFSFNIEFLARQDLTEPISLKEILKTHGFIELGAFDDMLYDSFGKGNAIKYTTATFMIDSDHAFYLFLDVNLPREGEDVNIYGDIKSALQEVEEREVFLMELLEKLNKTYTIVTIL